MSSRREARERVLQALYAHAQGGGDAEYVEHIVLEPPLEDDPEASAFARELFHRTLSLTDEEDELIRRHAQNWDLERIDLIDRLLLRTALCELLAFEDIPPKVSIDEALEIAKRFSSERSPAFINGILDAALQELKETGQLKKSGRGRRGMEDTQTEQHLTD